MHLTLVRYILISFLVTAAIFIVAGLVALSSLEQVADQFSFDLRDVGERIGREAGKLF